MRRKVEHFLDDILRAGRDVKEYMDGRTYEDFLSNKMFHDALVRKLQIIGEALVQISKLEPDLAERFPEKRGIIGFRNVIVHNYWRTNNQVVWGIAENYLDSLLEQAQALLSELE